MTILAERKALVYTLPVFLAWCRDGGELVWTRKNIRGVHKADILNELRMWMDSMLGSVEAETHRIFVIDFEVWEDELGAYWIDPIPEELEDTETVFYKDREEILKIWGDSYGRRERLLDEFMRTERKFEHVDAYDHESVMEFVYIKEYPADGKATIDHELGDNHWAIIDSTQCFGHDFPDTDYLQTAILSNRPARGVPDELRAGSKGEELFRRVTMAEARRLAYFAAREKFVSEIAESISRYTIAHEVRTFLSLNASQIFDATHTGVRGL